MTESGFGGIVARVLGARAAVDRICTATESETEEEQGSGSRPQSDPPSDGPADGQSSAGRA